MAGYEAKTSRGPADESATGSAKKDSTASFLRKAVKQFARAETKESKNRQMALEDLRFKNGEQWPEDIKASRTIEKRPCLTINKMQTFVHQITNDQRQNRPSIGVSPVGDRSDPQTAKDYKGLIKAIERQSKADIAYDTGFDSAVSIGWGYWRILTEYEYDGSFDQCIRIKRIPNPFRVYLDPDSTEPDGCDAKWAFITDMIPREQFDEDFPDATPQPWEEQGMGEDDEKWSTETHIRIAEYFCYESTKRNLVRLENGHVGYEDELDPLLADAERIEERDVYEKRVKWYKITSKQILEESDWLGKHIPIVRVIGDEVNIEGETTYAGLIRAAKDPQRMYNYWVTSETELIALAPKAPFIMAEGQIEGHEREWKSANIKSYPFLLYKETSVAGHPAPPPQRQQFDGPPAGIVQAKIAAAQDIQAVTGIRFDATEQERMYDESGKALRELKRVGDLGNFHYVDNLARSLRYTGEILIDLIPKVLDRKKILTMLREDDSEEQIMLDPTAAPGDKEQMADGRTMRLFNPNNGKYGVTVTIGPNYSTKRAEAADSMMAFMTAVPTAAPYIGDLIAKNMDWPGSDEISARLQSLLPPNMLDKKLDQLPAEARGMIMNLMQQTQKATQERDQAVAMLGDAEKDREIQRQALGVEVQKINANYEAKIADVQATFVAKMQEIEAKGGDPGAEMDMKLREIQADFTAQITKNALDHKAKLEEIDARNKQHTNEMLVKLAEAEAKHHLEAAAQKDAKEGADKDREMAQNGMRRETDRKKVDEAHQTIKELQARLKQAEADNEADVEFEHDEKTGRIKSVKRGGVRINIHRDPKTGRPKVGKREKVH